MITITNGEYVCLLLAAFGRLVAAAALLDGETLPDVDAEVRPEAEGSCEPVSAPSQIGVPVGTKISEYSVSPVHVGRRIV